MILFLTRWILYALSITFIAWILPGIQVSTTITALFVVVTFALVNTVLKPILLAITLPINFLTLGLFTLFINAFLLWITGIITPGFEVRGFWSAIFGALILSVLSGFISNIGHDD